MYVLSTEEDNTTHYTALDQMTDNPFHLREDHSKDSSLNCGRLSDEEFYIIILFMIYTSQLINTCAIIANSLIIAVFVKLGFSEPSNISLTALAICDFTLAVLITWINLCFWLTYNNVRLPFHGVNVSFLTGSAQWAFLSSTVAWITAFISFERCLCILVPLKVRRLITPRGTFVAMLIIILLTFCPSFFTYIWYKFVWVFNPNLNLTILNIIPVANEFAVLFEKITIVICGVIQPLLAFSIVLICTVLLVVQLRKISSWRMSVTSSKSQRVEAEENPAAISSGADARISQKEERLVRMVVAIATIFIVSYIPTCIMLLCYIVFDEFNQFGVYKRLFIVSNYIISLGQPISGSVNILIYYKMACLDQFSVVLYVWIVKNKRDIDVITSGG
ncbi:LOW QUALITY PROTEIN: chemosensory receptor a [Plakobranchus ocellatus]|uniref:Chemosensory receptor a n=1 Tax=Plakobranchus ocellatus TaxID=259542 RepID=A0AAV4CDG5_9GAST|nr:LOW QUALITY PROTEIN: chemosensory receptor a [Plakobranchus ocellatus]